MSTRRDYRGYDELIMLEPKLSKGRTVPAAVNLFSSSSKKVTSENNFWANTQLKEASKIHPIFRRRKRRRQLLGLNFRGAFSILEREVLVMYCRPLPPNAGSLILLL
ncbi:hypothetical protein R3W88_006355 [Solanum pinnatisectum]|uniref:Uncharacterized protein n=1 Tax=Solanum pinnatisectum TaxID=50273 RepID=A0AAV9KFA0_9SOLN|nr:hypothetical protein R3W88_006355 [Solanum pinnatisectum]